MNDSTKLAREFMVTRLVTLRPQTEVFDAIRLLLKNDISGAPVVDEDRNYLGVFSEKCCMSVLTQAARRAKEADRRRVEGTRAADFMVSRLIKLTPRMDVFEAIGHLLKNRISGAPVIDAAGNFLGVFSEKTSMRVLVESAYAQLPTAEVGAFMNEDQGRAITEDVDLLTVAEAFINTPYRRMAVVRDNKLVGQISRRDVLRKENSVSKGLFDHKTVLRDQNGSATNGSTPPSEEELKTDVGSFMSVEARTIDEDTDLLTIAQTFLETPYRRLPVVKDGKLIGQVSRRDVLHATNSLIVPPVRARESSILYLSSLIDRNEAPFP